MPFVAMVIGDLERALLVLLVLCIVVNIDVKFFLRPGHHGGAKGLTLSVWEMALYGLLAIRLIKSALRSQLRNRFTARWSVPFLGIICLSTLSLVGTADVALGLFEIVQLLKMYLLFYCAANLIETRSEVQFVVVVLLGALFVENLLGWTQYLFDNPFDYSILGGSSHLVIQKIGEIELPRISGTWASSNYLARYLGLMMPLPGSLLFSHIDGRYKFLCALLVMMSLGLLVFTFSRGAWIASLVSIPLILILQLRAHPMNLRMIRRLLILTLVIVATVLSFSKFVGGRFSEDDHGSARSRIYMMQVAVEIIKAHPLLGVGINNYQAKMAAYDHTAIRIATQFPEPVHSLYLMVAAEIGLLGLGLLLWIVFSLYRTAWRYLGTSSDHFLTSVMIGLVAGFSAFLIHAFVDKVSLGNHVFILFWFASGLLVAISNSRSSQGESRWSREA